MPDLDEDILRQLMFRATDALFAPPAAAGEAIRRQRRLRMRKRVLSAAGTAAAAGLAAGALASASGSGGPGGRRLEQNGATAPAGHPADRRAAGAVQPQRRRGQTPRPHGRYVVLTEQSISTGSSGGTKSSESGGKTSVIDTITGGGVTYQDITVSGSPGTPTPPGVLKAVPGTSPTVAQLDAMPTNPARLRDVLLAQAREQIRQGEQAMEQQLKKLGELGKKKLIAHQPAELANDLIFEQATDLLWEPDLSPALRSAVYKVLAATPGVSVQTGAADSSGRPATEISRVNTVAHDDAETFLNPATGATLESAWAYPSGEFDADLYQKISYTNTFPSDPYNG